jgi:hypothetical protein
MAGLPLILVSPSIEKHGVEFRDPSVSSSLKNEMLIPKAGGKIACEVTLTAGSLPAKIRPSESWARTIVSRGAKTAMES